MIANFCKIHLAISGGLPAPNNNVPERLTIDVNPNDEALVIIEKLKGLRPLPQSNPPIYYKLYRD